MPRTSEHIKEPVLAKLLQGLVNGAERLKRDVFRNIDAAFGLLRTPS
jgi:hypothetical protein